MIDHRFYSPKGPFTVGELMRIGECERIKKGEGARDDHAIRGVASLLDASENDIAVLHHPKYIDDFKRTKAHYCVIDPKFEVHAPQHITLLITPFPYRAYAKIATAFFPDVDNTFLSQNTSIHPTAKIGKECMIEYGAVIGPNVEIGDQCKIGAHTVV